MFGLPLAFAAPAVLAALVGLAALYFFLRVTPPRPRQAVFPPLRLLIGLDPKETTPARTPWPLLVLRLAIGALVMLAMAGPIWNSFAALAGSGPLLVLIDDGLAAAPSWDRRIAVARERRSAAARARPLVAIRAISQGGLDVAPLDRPASKAGCARWRRFPTRRTARRRCRRSSAFSPREPKTEILWIADGLELGGAGAFSDRLAAIARSVEVVTDGRGALALAGVDNEAGALNARLTRSDATRSPRRRRCGRSTSQGRVVGRAPFDFGANTTVDAHFELPVELRNEVPRVVVDDERSAGATWLIDERSRRRRVAIASGASADVAQPLLAPNYYLRRALEPFADIREWHESSSDPIVSLLDEKPSVLVLADMSVPPGPERDAITQFLDNGGVLLRFAGTRLAAGDDDSDADGAAPRRTPAGRRAVLGDAEAYRAVRGGQPVLRPRCAGRGDGFAAGAGRAGNRAGRQDLGAARRRHAARHRRAARQRSDRAVPRHRRHDLVEPAAVGPVRRHAASNRGRGRRAGPGRREGQGRRAWNGPAALANAERFWRSWPAARAGRTDRR